MSPAYSYSLGVPLVELLKYKCDACGAFEEIRSGLSPARVWWHIDISQAGSHGRRKDSRLYCGDCATSTLVIKLTDDPPQKPEGPPCRVKRFGGPTLVERLRSSIGRHDKTRR